MLHIICFFDVHFQITTELQFSDWAVDHLHSLLFILLSVFYLVGRVLKANSTLDYNKLDQIHCKLALLFLIEVKLLANQLLFLIRVYIK